MFLSFFSSCFILSHPFFTTKLLGWKSNDIDFVVGGELTGEQFATLLSDSIQSDGGEVSKPAVVRKNPAQSKHLDTAIAKLFVFPPPSPASP